MEFGRLKLFKCIFEIRHFPCLFYEEKRRIVFSRLEEKYSAMKLTRELIEARNDQKSIKIFSEWHRAGVAVENLTNFSYFRDETNNLITALMKEYEISKIDRVGTRLFYVLPSDDPVEILKKKLSTGFYKTEFLNLFGEAVSDFGVLLNCTSGETSHRFYCGPMDGKEIILKAELEFPPQDIPDNALFFDIDSYKTTFEGRQVKSFIEGARTKAENWIIAIRQMLEEGA